MDNKEDLVQTEYRRTGRAIANLFGGTRRPQSQALRQMSSVGRTKSAVPGRRELSLLTT